VKGWAKAIRDAYPTMQQMHNALVELSKAIEKRRLSKWKTQLH